MWPRRILWLTAPVIWSGFITSNAFLLPTSSMNNIEAMKILAMNLRFDNDQIQNAQKHELFKHAGYNDYQLFMNKAITKDQYLESVKKTFKDELITSFLEKGGIDIGQPLWRKLFFDDEPDKIFAEMIGLQEPLNSIVRLIRSDDDDENEYGQKLLKKYQYKQFNNPNGGPFEQNMDHFLLADSDGRKKLIKEILSEEWFSNIEDPLQKAILKLWHQSRDIDDATKKAAVKQNIKDLQYIQFFESTLPENTPVKQEDLYLFYKLTDGRIDASDLLNIAQGSEIGPIQDTDFEFYFGASAQEFTCRAHEPTIMVTCGVMLKPDECHKAGCCYSDSEEKCYHNLYGKIGSSVARKVLIDNNQDFSDWIADYFPSNEIPTLDSILRSTETPYGVTLNEMQGGVYVPMVDDELKINAVKRAGEHNWWEQATLWGDNYFENGPNGNARESIVLNQKVDRKKYGRQGYKWKPHGATAAPILSEIPGLNPTAHPLSNGLASLSDYYKQWLEFSNQHDQYKCSLIPKDSRITCMRNFEALKDYANAENKCLAAGCCYSEEEFLKGNDACYRAVDYGTCENLPTEFKKTECGWDGITENECLANPKCCFNPTSDVGVPWCHYKMSATLDGENGWCEAWSNEKLRHIERPACFVTSKTNLFTDTEASNINNLVSQETCEKAGCCFDDSLNVEEIEFLKDGLGLANAPTRCFKKSNPYIEQTINGGTYGGQLQDPNGKTVGLNTEIDLTALNYNKDGAGNIVKNQDKLEPQRWNEEYVANGEFPEERPFYTCDATNWIDMFKFKRSCGENLSYYQCVYVNKCCYKPNFINQPTCYKPEIMKQITV